MQGSSTHNQYKLCCPAKTSGSQSTSWLSDKCLRNILLDILPIHFDIHKNNCFADTIELYCIYMISSLGTLEKVYG